MVIEEDVLVLEEQEELVVLVQLVLRIVEFVRCKNQLLKEKV
jgi:hypothetical protein